MGLLKQICGPDDVKKVPEEKLPALAQEIRDLLIEEVTRSGGHLGSNLGVVELTIAVHRVFDSPKDAIIWDTGHQAYVHKLLTGRAGALHLLRQRGGLSGYPCRGESAHDVSENSHASTALSYADGFARAVRLQSDTDRQVVAVVGDGSLTGGMAWEALNNIGADGTLGLVVVLNDNGRSYSPTVGGLAVHLSRLRGGACEGSAPILVEGSRSEAQTVFGQMGLSYIGPVDGHNLTMLQAALRKARAQGGPSVVHCYTSKGRGYGPAESDPVDRFHAVPAAASAVRQVPAATSWTSVFGDAMVRLATARDDVVAVTAAMLGPTGLAACAALFPERVFDVGIAEQHALTCAAGLAMGGLRPVVAMYSTFLNRGFDQLLMDVALHRCPVVLVLDRAGVTGDDGASHNGMWDLPLLRLVPGMHVAAPRDGATLRRALDESVRRTDGPSAIRFPKGNVGPDVPAVRIEQDVDVLSAGADQDVLLVGVGALCGLALQVAALLEAAGVRATVVDPRWVQPVPEGLVAMAESRLLVVTMEDGLAAGGFGEALSRELHTRGAITGVLPIGLPSRFLAQGSRPQVLAANGLTAEAVAGQVLRRIDVHRPSDPDLGLIDLRGDGVGQVSCPAPDGPGAVKRAGTSMDEVGAQVLVDLIARPTSSRRSCAMTTTDDQRSVVSDEEQLTSARVGMLVEQVAAQLSRDWSASSQLHEVCRYAVSAPGKLFRPILLLESAAAVGGDVAQVLPAAAGAEGAHVASLIHDDIIDGDETRRGQQATHVQFGRDSAIVGGDALIFYLFSALADCVRQGVDEARIVTAMSKAAQAGQDLCRGQMLEEEIRATHDCKISSYVTMVECKTAALFRACCFIGATLGGGTPTQAAALSRYGSCLGIAFQMQDDLLPFIGDGHLVGKSPWSDLVNRRLTLPFLLGRAGASPDVVSELDALLMGGGPVEGRHRRMAELLERSGAIDRAVEMANGYIDQAVEALTILDDSPSKRSLLHFAQAAVRRNA